MPSIGMVPSTAIASRVTSGAIGRRLWTSNQSGCENR
jgi:hypothetical protein